ncbi:hypothetical protein EBZ38_03465 [bacterium]|nr:hypothetical protein [bacterium]NDC94021.1 hypothetical protein [bacterium]NDD83326.1 hypothetical protein [bacterium]
MFLVRNSKIKKSVKRTFNFGIPAYLSSTGLKTCPNAGACAKGCYALAGAYRFSNVAQAFERRLAATQSDSFIDAMLSDIDKQRAERIRIHDSGDFYNEEYLDRWLKIMRARPHVEFYAYTKMVSLFNRRKNDLPKNFTLIYSFGGTEDKLIDVDKDRHSLVFETVAQLKACGYADASNQDDIALGKNPKIGLVYHGTKNIENTNWGKVPEYKRKAG